MEGLKQPGMEKGSLGQPVPSPSGMEGAAGRKPGKARRRAGPTAER